MILLSVAAFASLLQHKTLNVYAAASLKEAFTVIGRGFEAANPGVHVSLNFAGSQTLAAQIKQGALADVFASASAKNLNDTAYEKASLRIFAKNRLEIAVRRGLRNVTNLNQVASLLNLVVADPAVPVGRYTDAFLTKAGAFYGSLWLRTFKYHIVSREQDVKAVLTKVQLGEGDAGVVYASDVATAKGKVTGIDIPDSLNQIAEYPITTLTFAEDKDDAKRFIKYVLSPESERVLEASGFVSPTRPVHSLTLVSGTHSVEIPLPLVGKYPAATVEAADDQKKTAKYRGVLVSGLPGIKGLVTFIGGDGYSQTVSASELKTRKAVLVRNPDGNYQLIVPGLKPSVWVNWLRRIEVR